MSEAAARRPIALEFVRLARPRQWAKSVFVLIGPVYHMTETGATPGQMAGPVLIAAAAFSLASSGCYAINDALDAEADRAHPRKRSRPVASGAVSPGRAAAFGAALIIAAGLLVLALQGAVRGWVGLTLGLYVLNVVTYSFWFKHVLIADVMGLSMGFVLRVLGGCLAVSLVPTTWLVNCTFFLAMFLAFGKRLGERQTMGRRASAARAVQTGYTKEFLRMAVVVTAVGALVTYGAYAQSRADWFEPDTFNLMWLTVLPATFGLLRCIVLLERGVYDDPTELAFRDRGVQAAMLVFAAMTIGAVSAAQLPGVGVSP